jgi:cell shape-determining protein MreC
VGKVTEVFENFSTANLSSSPKFRLAVCLENCPLPMVFTGNGAHYPTDGKGYGWQISATVKNIPMEAESLLKIGNRIIASPLDSRVPNGLTLGHIEGVRPSTDGIFLEAEIALPRELIDFREVIIPIFHDQ